MSEIKLQERLREPVISTALKAGDFTWEHAERLIKDRVEAADALDAAESRISAQERHLTAIEVALGVHPYFGGAPLSSLVGKLKSKLDAAEAEIARLEEKISEIEGVWPDWASKLLDIIYPRDMRASGDEFDLPEDLKEWLAQCELQVRKTANKPAQPPAEGEDVVERAAIAICEKLGIKPYGLRNNERDDQPVDFDNVEWQGRYAWRDQVPIVRVVLEAASLLRTKDAG